MGESQKKHYLCPVEFVELLGEHKELFIMLAQIAEQYIAIHKIAHTGFAFENRGDFERHANALITTMQQIHNYTGQLLNEIQNNLHNYEEKHDPIVN
jgi:hypothetical protein